VGGYRFGVRRRIYVALAVVAVLGAAVALFWRPFPSDRTPEGAYLRIVRAVVKDRPTEAFAYLEEDARHAAYTVRDARARACARIEASYPEAERAALLAAWKPDGDAEDGADVFARHARERGWLARLRKDLSGIDHVERQGERATVVTVRGTRYPFRRRDNGIWGLTMFTAEMVAEAERASRDLVLVEGAAADYDRARSAAQPRPSGSP
jgi:hypothetical protein